MNNNKMGNEPILKLIVGMSLPAMFSMLIQAMYNIVDSIYVAQISEKALTAVSLAFPIQNLMIAVAVGTGVGLNSFISRSLGSKEQEHADSAASHGIILGVITWVIFAIGGLCFTNVFFSSFTNDADVIKMGCDYTYIVTIMSFGSFILINSEKIMQSTGNMIYPMILQLIGAITNIILDPIMIFGWLGFPAMGVAGAAIATVIAQILTMIIGVYILLYKKHTVKVSLKNFKLDLGIVKKIYSVGLPSMVMQSIGSFTVSGFNAILMSHSATAVAVLGIYFKLQSFVFMPVFGLTQGIMPIMGYNYGAKNKHRLLNTLKIGIVIAFVVMIIGTLIFTVFPAQLLMLFDASESMLQIGIPALRIVSLCFPFAALGIVLSTMFQSIGRGVYSLMMSIFRQLIIILPVAYLLATYVGLEATWYSMILAEGGSLILSLFMIKDVYKKQIKYLGTEDTVVEK